MAASSSDRNLLFGIVALQMDFIGRDALIGAMHAWALEKGRDLGAILVDRGDLPEPRRALLDALVDEHVRQHGGDPQRSLASLTSLGSAREALEQVADPDLQASLHLVSAVRHAGDPAPSGTIRSGRSTESDPASTATFLSQAEPPASRFRILRPHARGGLGAVFVALDSELNRLVALKQIQESHADRPESRSRFLVEAEITGGLEHPGVVPVYSLGHDGAGRPFYAMRFIEGDSLKRAIERFHADDAPRAPGPRSLEFRKLLRRFLDVCEAVAYAHSRGVLHRDLKPGNIMVGRFGETLVVDWGLAKVVGTPDGSGEATLRPPSASSSGETLPGSAVGTPSYMSPEQADGRLDLLGQASDVYSLGATLYALLTGRPPVDGPDTPSVLDRVRRGDFVPPRRANPDVPAALDAICLKAMALKPADRYPSPLALAADVEAYLADEPVSAWREPFPVRARRWARRHQRLVSGAAAAMAMGFVTLATLAVVVTHSNRRLDASNTRLADANSEILRQNARITAQNDQVGQANANLAVARTETERERDQAEAVTAFLVESFRSPDPARDGRSITIAEVLDRSVELLRNRQDLAPATRATILDAISASYLGLGLLPEAVEILQEARDLRVEVHGDDHPLTLATRNNLALAYKIVGRLGEAIPLFEATLKAVRATLGDDHPDTLITQDNLAQTHMDSGQLSEAIPLFEATLKAKRATLGDDHPDTLTTRNNLALAYQAAGRLGEAIPLFEATLGARRSTFGDDHPDTLTTRNNLALAYREAGRLGEAIPLFEATLEAQRRTLGDDHPGTLSTQANLAAAYHAARRLGEAIPLLEATLEAQRRTLGDDHPGTLSTQANLAAAYREAGRLGEAIPLLEATLEARRGKLGDDHPDTLGSRNGLGAGYLAAGRPGEAIPLLEQATRRLVAMLGDQHPRAIRAQNNLIRAYEAAGRFSDVEQIYRDRLEAARRLQPKDDDAYAGALDSLGDHLNAQRKHAEAEPILRECLALRERIAPGDWTTANARSLLGEALAGLGLFAEAEPLLLAGQRGIAEQVGSIPEDSRGLRHREALERLIRLYQAWGRPEQEARWRRELTSLRAEPSLPADVFAGPVEAR